MKGRASKNKGSNYEREIAAYFNEEILVPILNEGTARRALLSGGGRADGRGDVEGIPGLLVEAKRREKVNVREALRQAEADVERSEHDVIPVVITRMNREPTEDSIVVMRLKDFKDLYDPTNYCS